MRKEIYTITHKCGHTREVDLSWASWGVDGIIEEKESELCPDCEHERLMKLQEENGLPELKGSEKQVAWAMKIRQDFLDSLDRLHDGVDRDWNSGLRGDVEKEENKKKMKVEHAMIDACCAYMCEQTDAKFFINERDDLFSYHGEESWHLYDCMEIVKFYAKEFVEEHNEYRVAAKKEAEAKQVEVHPEEVTGGTKVWLSIQDDTVKLTSDYEARLVNIIHSLPFKMKWDGYRWNYKVESFRGTAEAVVAELGNRFLSKGYIVIFPDKEMADMSTSGEFEKYHINAVYRNKNNDKQLIVKMDANDEELKNLMYNIRGLNFSHYHDDIASVSVEHYKEVLEFAEDNGFAISPGAKEAIEKYKASFITATPAHVERDTAKAPGRKDVDLSDLNDD